MCTSFQKKNFSQGLSVVVHNPSTQEAETGTSLKFKVCLVYKMRPHLKFKKKKNKQKPAIEEP